ncbi:hypothetical protein CUN65_13540 [Enterobacter hormaechei subsp. xiangfangensis]|nr:hypothetical protein CUN65_13540 [Enterobacter hormaechei subsp. xiangfangensis]AXM02061.1 hypothetical protein DF208_13500 [Enterobacter hormaechei subsp. xiangfangensis]PTX86856.1 hypothetical protein C1N97_21960 [Enterobacter hormaechei]
MGVVCQHPPQKTQWGSECIPANGLNACWFACVINHAVSFVVMPVFSPLQARWILLFPNSKNLVNL